MNNVLPKSYEIKKSTIKKSFEVEETKYSIDNNLMRHLPFRYHRGRDTMLRQEQLKREDYE